MHENEQRSTKLVRLSDEGDIDDHRSQRIGEGFPLPRLMYRFNIHSAESSGEFEPHRIGIVVYKEAQSVHNHLARIRGLAGSSAAEAFRVGYVHREHHL